MAEKEEVIPHAEDEIVPEVKPEERPFEPFSEKQQAKVNALMNEQFKKAWTKATAEADAKQAESTAKLAEMQKQIEALSKPVVVEDPPKGKKKDDVPDQELLSVKSRLEEIEKAAKELKAERDSVKSELETQRAAGTETRIKEAFISASAKIDFYDPMEVFRLVRQDIAIDKDSGKVVVLNASGNPRLNSDMDPMSIAEFLAEFSKSKPYMVKAKNTEGGTGAGPSSRSTSGDKKVDYASLSKDDFAALTRKVIADQGR